MSDAITSAMPCRTEAAVGGKVHLILRGSDGHSFSGTLSNVQALRMVQLFHECEAMIAAAQQIENDYEI